MHAEFRNVPVPLAFSECHSWHAPSHSSETSFLQIQQRTTQMRSDIARA
jgi:hypothetical protein